MSEVKDHILYELLKDTYPHVDIDYVILTCDGVYEGPESHKKAVLEAFEILNCRFAEYEYQVEIRPELMEAEKSSIEELLKLPEDDCYEDGVKGERNFSIPKPIPYWFAFLEPPYGTPYRKSDFIAFHEILFPNREACEVYRWNDTFSDYFDAGKEWWGTGLWSVFDSKEGLMVVIGASLTD